MTQRFSLVLCDSLQKIQSLHGRFRDALVDEFVNIAVVPGKALGHCLVPRTIKLRVQDRRLLPKRPLGKLWLHVFESSFLLIVATTIPSNLI